MTTLPERLVGTIKNLINAHEEFRKEVEEFQALSSRIQSELDRLVPQKERLDKASLDGNGPMRLPRGIIPNAAEKPELVS